MTLAGEVHISLFHHAGLVHDLNIVSTRPRAAAQVLKGKTPEQVMFSVPLLFSLCGNAQSYAALMACQAAAGLPGDPAIDACHDTLVQIESIREHAWRVLLDWPVLTGHQANKSAVATLLKFDNQFKQSLFENGDAFKIRSQLLQKNSRRLELVNELKGLIDAAIFAGRMAEFLSLTSETQLVNWLCDNDGPAANCLNEQYLQKWQTIGRSNASILPELQLPELHQALSHCDLNTFSQAPRWKNQSCETTPFSRQQHQPLLINIVQRYGNGLLARCLALLLEIAEITENLDKHTAFIVGSGSGRDNIGLAMVNAARGLLIHRAELHHGKIHDYWIIAPTEWNFHPEGVLAQSLRALSANDADSLKNQAIWLIQAIDPCVRFKLTMNEI